jgi:hypothetical protein
MSASVAVSIAASVAAASVAALPKVKTEDLGKTVEYALCSLLSTPFDGKFRYAADEAARITSRFAPLADLYAGYKHTGKTSNLYDFTSADDSTHLSVKTTKEKNSWAVCPQIIGQPTKKRFCAAFGLPEGVTNDDIKVYIQANLHSLLAAYYEHTFHCPVLFYNKATDAVYVITPTGVPIDWHAQTYTYSHVRAGKAWNESTTVLLQKPDGSGTVSLGEFQIHNHRSAIKFRFNLKTVMDTFAAHFDIVQH